MPERGRIFTKLTHAIPIIALAISISLFLPGCYYDTDDMESAYDNGLMDGYDDGYYDGYHDALVDNGLAYDPPPITTYAEDETPAEKHLSAGNIFGLVIMCGFGLLLIWMVVFPIVDSAKKKRDRNRTFNENLWGRKK